LEIVHLDQHVGIRNSTSPHETIVVSLPAFRDLVARIKNGELDG